MSRVEQPTALRVRQTIAETLASREIDPPAGFVQFQIARLSEAMILARTMMMQDNLQAMDRWIKLTSELDRYHGFSPAQIPWARRRRAPRRAGARVISSNRGASLAGIAPREGLTAKRSRPEMAPQRLEKIESAPGNGMGSEALNPQDVVHGRAADGARLRLASRENDERAPLQRKAPKALISLDAELKSAPRRDGPSRASKARGAEPRGWPGRAWTSPAMTERSIVRRSHSCSSSARG
jgi:hypothetical protein